MQLKVGGLTQVRRMDGKKTEGFGACFWNLARDIKMQASGQDTAGNVMGYRKPALPIEVFVNAVPTAQCTPPPSLS